MPLDSITLKVLNYDWDAREVWIREIVRERLAIHPPPRRGRCDRGELLFCAADHASRERGGGNRLPRHQRHQDTRRAGSLLEACTAKAAGVDAFDSDRPDRPACTSPFP